MYNYRFYLCAIGVDDGISECDLDDVQDWDLVLMNNSTEEGKKAVEILLDHIKQWQEEFQLLQLQP